jgi:hypothetical protein
MEDHLPTQAAENIFQTETIANAEAIKVQSLNIVQMAAKELGSIQTHDKAFYNQIKGILNECK